MKQKYFAHKVSNAFGTFDSVQEYERFLYLRHLQDIGAISNLERQVSFEIIPKLTILKEVRLKTKTKIVERVDEQAAKYTPDFCYYKDGVYVIEEVKSKGSMLARDYPLRRKLMKQIIEQHNKNSDIMWVFNEVGVTKNKKLRKEKGI